MKIKKRLMTQTWQNYAKHCSYAFKSTQKKYIKLNCLTKNTNYNK